MPHACITHPFLPVAIFHIVDAPVVPVATEVKQGEGEEAVLRHDDKVGEEAGGGLHHSNLAIGHTDQPAD